MNLQKIYRQLGIETDLANEVLKFNNRLKAVIKELDDTIYADYLGYDSMVCDEVKFILGESTGIARLQSMIQGNVSSNLNLQANMIVVSTILEVLKTYKRRPGLYEYFLNKVKKLFNLTLLDIGYAFIGDSIVKKGADELDQALISQTLVWMEDYPDSKEKFENSLRLLLNKDYPDAITNAYSSFEGMVKVFLGIDSRLDNEKTIKKLITNLDLDSYWGQIVNHYCKIAHEFSSRHGKKEQKKKNNLSPEIVEFYVYMTGSFIRVIIERMNSIND